MPQPRRLPKGSLFVAGMGALVAVLTGCFVLDAQVVRPVELTGKWVRMRVDGTWGDTVEYRADGQVLRSAALSTSSTEQWRVVRSKPGGEGFCAGAPGHRSCQPFRLDGDTLLVLGRLENSTYLLRVR